MKILSFGSLNIDYVFRVPHFVQKGETISSLSLGVYSGGKGLNQSMALARAGMNVYHAGAIGKDGLFLKSQLREAGVDVSHLMVRENEYTGQAIIQNDPSGDNSIILYGGANQSITPDEAAAIISCFDRGDSIILQNEISSLADIIKLASEQGLNIILNPSPMNESILALPLELVDMFILNEIEGALLTGCEISDSDSARQLTGRLHESFPKADIVLTLGENGSMACVGGELFTQPAFRVHAVDTTAAGDTYTGFLIAALSNSMTFPEAMKLAAKASAIAVTRAGASPSIPSLSEVLAADGL